LEQAFVGGKVRPEVLGELYWHVHLMKVDDYDKFERVLRGHRATLAYLGRAFKNYPVRQKQYAEWDGDLAVVREEGWYAHFTPDVAEEIAASYFDHIRSLARDEFSEATLFRMCCTFPDLENTPHELIGDLKYKIRRALITKDFSRVPSKYLVGRGRVGAEGLRSVFRKSLRRYCLSLAVDDDRRLWLPRVEVAKIIGVPGPVFEDVELLSILNEARILSVELMDNNAFRKLFSSQKGTFANQRLFLDHSHTAALNPANYDDLCSKVRSRAELIGLKRVG
jgi:hypothetical protein